MGGESKILNEMGRRKKERKKELLQLTCFKRERRIYTHTDRQVCLETWTPVKAYPYTERERERQKDTSISHEDVTCV